MFEGMEKVPWHRLEHAYGQANDAPKWIRALASDDENLRSDAVYYFLHSAVCHQGTLDSATPFVIPIVIEAPREPQVIGRTVSRERCPSMEQGLLEFLVCCARSYRPTDAVVHATQNGRETYAAFVDG